MTRLAASYSARLDGYLREASRIAETAARVVAIRRRVFRRPGLHAARKQRRADAAGVRLVPGVRAGNAAAGRRAVCTLCLSRPNGLAADEHRPESSTIGTAIRSSPGISSPRNSIAACGASRISTRARATSSCRRIPRLSTPASRSAACAPSTSTCRGLRETVGREFDERLDFVIVAADGRYVFHPDASRIMARTVFEYLDEAGRGRAGAGDAADDRRRGRGRVDRRLGHGRSRSACSMRRFRRPIGRLWPACRRARCWPTCGGGRSSTARRWWPRCC